MFERILLENAANGRRGPWTVAVSVLLQSLLIGIAVLVPLFDTPAIARKVLVVLGPPLGPPAVGERVARTQVRRTPRYEFVEGRLLAPRRIPDKAESIVDESPLEATDIAVGPPGFPRGIPNGLGLNWITGVKVPEPPPPTSASTRPSDKVKVQSDLQQAKLINQPKPVYPQLAKQARISGTVRLAAIISEAGNIEELRVLQGHPLLVQAAVDAVQQWRYRPTFLNGVPVKVETTIDVIFTLSQ